jgi:excisionase family DNA binding protein
MTAEERFKTLLSATPDKLVAVDSILAELPKQNRPSLRLLRMNQAAKETGLSRVTLFRAIRDGYLRVVEVRKGSRRISESELLRFVGVRQ